MPLTDPGALVQALKVVEYKTSRYTVIRPVQLGAVLGGAQPDLMDGLAQFGSALGCAFQLRDDLLGVFGDEAKTGKPAGDDLREGKRTVVIAEAMSALTSSSAARLQALLHHKMTEAEIAEAQRLIIDSGAVARTEARIQHAYAESLRILGALPLTEPGSTALGELARLCVEREA